jgi:hypothetical protein
MFDYLTFSQHIGIDPPSEILYKFERDVKMESQDYSDYHFSIHSSISLFSNRYLFEGQIHIYSMNYQILAKATSERNQYSYRI